MVLVLKVQNTGKMFVRSKAPYIAYYRYIAGIVHSCVNICSCLYMQQKFMYYLSKLYFVFTNQTHFQFVRLILGTNTEYVPFKSYLEGRTSVVDELPWCFGVRLVMANSLHQIYSLSVFELGHV